MVAGEEVGDIFRGGRAYDVVVWSVPEARNSVDAVANMLIDTPTGHRVRLADVATVAVHSSPNAVERENGSRHLDVLADGEGRDLGSVGSAVEDMLD